MASGSIWEKTLGTDKDCCSFVLIATVRGSYCSSTFAESKFLFKKKTLSSNEISCVFTGNTNFFSFLWIAQSTGTAEYTVCNSAEGEDPSSIECPGYDTKQSDGEVPEMLELWGMLSTLLLPSLPSLLLPAVVAPHKFLSVGQIKLKCVLMLNWIFVNRTVNMYKNGFGIK